MLTRTCWEFAPQAYDHGNVSWLPLYCLARVSVRVGVRRHWPAVAPEEVAPLGLLTGRHRPALAELLAAITTKTAKGQKLGCNAAANAASFFKRDRNAQLSPNDRQN